MLLSKLLRPLEGAVSTWQKALEKDKSEKQGTEKAAGMGKRWA